MAKKGNEKGETRMENPLTKDIRRIDNCHWSDTLEFAANINILHRSSHEAEFKPENFKNLALQIAEKSMQEVQDRVKMLEELQKETLAEFIENTIDVYGSPTNGTFQNGRDHMLWRKLVSAVKIQDRQRKAAAAADMEAAKAAA